MLIMGKKPRHPAGAEPRAQAIHKPIEIAWIRMGGQIDLFRRSRFGAEHGKARHIESKARIERIGEGSEALHEQRADVLSIA